MFPQNNSVHKGLKTPLNKRQWHRKWLSLIILLNENMEFDLAGTLGPFNPLSASSLNIRDDHSRAITWSQRCLRMSKHPTALYHQQA